MLDLNIIHIDYSTITFICANNAKRTLIGWYFMNIHSYLSLFTWVHVHCMQHTIYQNYLLHDITFHRSNKFHQHCHKALNVIFICLQLYTPKIILKLWK